MPSKCEWERIGGGTKRFRTFNEIFYEFLNRPVTFVSLAISFTDNHLFILRVCLPVGMDSDHIYSREMDCRIPPSAQTQNLYPKTGEVHNSWTRPDRLGDIFFFNVDIWCWAHGRNINVHALSRVLHSSQSADLDRRVSGSGSSLGDYNCFECWNHGKNLPFCPQKKSQFIQFKSLTTRPQGNCEDKGADRTQPWIWKETQGSTRTDV